MKVQIIQNIIDVIRCKRLKLAIKRYFNVNPNAVRLVLNILSLYSPKGVCKAKNNFLKFCGTKMNGEHVHLSGNITIHAPENLEMGNYTSLGQNAVLYCWEKVSIGDYTFMGPNNVFVSGGHNKLTFESECKPIKIGKGCWIGANCTFLGGGELGAGCIVGAGTVLLGKKYPPFSVLAGVPARIINKREIPKTMKIPTEYEISEIMEETT